MILFCIALLDQEEQFEPLIVQRSENDSLIKINGLIYLISDEATLKKIKDFFNWKISFIIIALILFSIFSHLTGQTGFMPLIKLRE